MRSITAATPWPDSVSTRKPWPVISRRWSSIPITKTPDTTWNCCSSSSNSRTGKITGKHRITGHRIHRTTARTQHRIIHRIQHHRHDSNRPAEQQDSQDASGAGDQKPGDQQHAGSDSEQPQSAEQAGSRRLTRRVRSMPRVPVKRRRRSRQSTRADAQTSSTQETQASEQGGKSIPPTWPLSVNNTLKKHPIPPQNSGCAVFLMTPAVCCGVSFFTSTSSASVAHNRRTSHGSACSADITAYPVCSRIQAATIRRDTSTAIR